MAKISVIIPCYNGWQYMEKCLMALENQTVSPTEIIIVDDCSSDESFKRLQEYKENTKLNIVLLKNKMNSGPGVSRKKAIDVVLGEYIVFCDCDDWYELDFIKTIEDKIDSDSDADVVIFDYFKAHADSKIPANSTALLVNMSKAEILANAKMSLCCFAVKKEIMQRVICPPLYHGEDGAITPQIIAKANNICVLEKPLYNYLYREDSVSLKPTPGAYVELVEAFGVAKTVIQDEFYSECEFIGIKYVCYGAVLNAFKAKISCEKIVAVLTEFEKDFPDWISNSYIRNLGIIKNVYLYFIRKRWFLPVRVMSSMHDFYISLRRK